MITQPKTLIFPGSLGQPAYCQYQIAFSDHYLARPKIFILLDHEEGYAGTVVVNNDVSCDCTVNKIFNHELSGISFYDVEIFYKCNLVSEPPEIHKIPFQLDWQPKLTLMDKVRLKMGQKLFFSPVSDREKCGEYPVKTKPNLPISLEEFMKISELFELNDCKPRYEALLGEVA